VIADPVFSARTTARRARENWPQSKSRRWLCGHAADRHLADDSGLIIRRLKFTRQEADQILAEAPRAKTSKAVISKLTGPWPRCELSKYRYVHFGYARIYR